MSRDPGTYGRIRRKYDEWVEIRREKPAPAPRALPAQQTFTPQPHGPDMGKNVFAAIGVLIGLALLALAAISFYAAATWAGYARDGASTGYFVVGFFLALAGLGGIAATLNHNYRVLARPGGHH